MMLSAAALAAGQHSIVLLGPGAASEGAVTEIVSLSLGQINRMRHPQICRAFVRMGSPRLNNWMLRRLRIMEESMHLDPAIRAGFPLLYRKEVGYELENM